MARITALDAVRAVAIISMTLGHVANYSFVWLVSHLTISVWDGANLFVLVSGLVVGIVYRRRIEARGMKVAARALIKRAGFLYLLQLALVILAITFAYKIPTETSWQFLVPGLDYPQAVLWSLWMGVNPIYVNFLSLYVVLLIAAVPLLALLQRRRFTLTAVLLAVLYAAGLSWPSAFTLPNGPEQSNGFNNATWFVLFASGVFVGWLWRERSMDQSITSPRAMRWVFPLAAVFISLAAMDVLKVNTGSFIFWLTDKDLLGPGRFLASWVFMTVLLFLAERLQALAATAPLINSLAVLGSRSLDAVVVLTLVTIALQGPLAIDSASRLAQLVAVATIAACWIWAYARQPVNRPLVQMR